MSAAGRDLAANFRAIYDLDLAKLPQIARLGVLSQRVSSTLALVTAAGERDLRRKLRRAHLPGEVSAAQVRARAWLITRGLRMAAGALRQASAQSVAYRVELEKHFVVPARELARSGGRSSGGFDVLGGL